MKIDTNTLLEEEAHLESGEKKKPCIGDIITLTCINSVYGVWGGLSWIPPMEQFLRLSMPSLLQVVISFNADLEADCNHSVKNTTMVAIFSAVYQLQWGSSYGTG